MISVNCVVESSAKNGGNLIVRSVKDPYRIVEISIGAETIRVYADDLATAIENCSHNGYIRHIHRNYRGLRSEDEESEE